MPPELRPVLFLFRRDLRLGDNLGLLEATRGDRRVLPAFIFDPRQQAAANPYFSPPAFRFLLESLSDLGEQLARAGGRLYLFDGLPQEVLRRLVEEVGLAEVHVNRDYTPFSRARDDQLREICRELGVRFHDHSDALLTEPGTVLTGAGGTYSVFTPFYRNARERPVPRPRQWRGGELFREDIAFALGLDSLAARQPTAGLEPHLPGGRQRGVEILGRLRHLRTYPETREQPALDGTSSLSAHHKFGTVSIRESYHAIAGQLGTFAEPLLRQLYWRDFFTHLAEASPRVFGHAFQERYEEVEWDEDEERLEAWCRGETGFPIVDAGMRQLQRSGWMHNRVRMITASFLTKDLHLHWRRGERHFARHLVDYDPAVNNGNWQWAASTGADAQPYFRIFNPWSQQQTHDADGAYIRRWVPELAAVEPRDLHRLHLRRPAAAGRYPPPMVDHRRESVEAKERFARLR